MRALCYSIFILWAVGPAAGLAQTSAGVDPGKQACTNFNIKIQAATDTLYTMASLWGTTFLDQYNGDQKYEELIPVRTDLQDYIELVLKDFKEMQDVSGSQKLQSALVSLFEFEQGLMTNGFQPFEKLTNASADKDINACRDKLKEESLKESSYLRELNAARKEYTSRNGIPLVPPTPVKHDLPAPTRKPVAQTPGPAMKPIPKPQPIISEPVSKKDQKGEDEDDDKADKEEKEDKTEK